MVKTIAILCAMDSEVNAVLNKFDRSKVNTAIRHNITFHIIEDEKLIVIVLLCGCGKVNAAISTTVTILSYAPDYIFNCGVAGGLRKEQKVLDVVIATEFVYHDVDIEVLNLKPGQLLAEPVTFTSDETMRKYVQEIENGEKNNFCFHYGVIGSGDQFISRTEQHNLICSKFPDVICVEMEGCAIAHVCEKYKVPLLSIRSLSDIAVADHDNSVDFVKLCEAASNQAAEIMYKLISKII